MTNTEFYDLTNAAVLGWTAAVKRACDRQPTSHPENLTAETICSVTGLLPLYPFNVPEGMVATGPMSIEIVDGAAHKRYATVTIEAHESARAAWEAEEAIRIEAERIAFAAAEVERKNTPIVYDQPLEAPAIVLQSQSQGLGVGVCATDDGDLVTFTYHASPVPEAAEIKRRIAKAVADHKARKQADKTERDTLKAQLADARGKLAAVETEVEKIKGKKQEVTK